MDIAGDMAADMPVTLTVKAPNQRIADQNVECTLGWTIRKLKEHLQHVYPNKPKHTQQKLIYSGKLLEDNLTLKQVLRQDHESANHTVHLVCAAFAETFEENQNSEKSPSSTDGLRQRVTSSHVSSSSSRSSQVPNGSQNYPQPPYSHMTPGYYPQMYGASAMYGTNPMYAASAMFGGMNPMYMYNRTQGGYTPEQYNIMMQQMYTQYMNQYMHYYSQATGVTPPPSPAATVTPPNEAVDRNAGNARPANQNMRMNAQGGIVEDDDEENGDRDWLDCIYIMFRFLVLVSIVYFYSTLTRSIAVFLVFVLIYFLQKGWVMLRQRHPVRVAPAPQAQETPEEQPNDDTAPANETDNNTDTNNTNQEGSPENTEDSPQQTEESVDPPTPAPPGVLTTAWCFITTFFSSLIPEQPVAVNQN